MNFEDARNVLLGAEREMDALLTKIRAGACCDAHAVILVAMAATAMINSLWPTMDNLAIQQAGSRFSDEAFKLATECEEASHLH